MDPSGFLVTLTLPVTVIRFYVTCLSEFENVCVWGRGRGVCGGGGVDDRERLTWQGRLWLGQGRRVESPVQVPPELLLVLSVDELKHTLVHHVRLEAGEREQRDVQF